MFSLRRRMLACISPIHTRLRGRKLELFFRLASVAPEQTLLDVGGAPGFGGEFQPLYDSFGRVVTVNLRIDSAAASRGHSCVVGGDGCALPFRSHAFDWVFSNAVIEHVGGWEKQRSFASEVRRVARKGYFLATPNRNFPIEPHALWPFYQFASPGLQRQLLRIWAGYLTTYEEINLLSHAQLHALFPEAKILRTGFPGLRNSLVAFWQT
jgi:SAM-dependent methyltransferase